MSRRGLALFLALSVIWGLPYLMIRVAVQNGIDPATLVFLRTAPTAIILVPIAWRAGALHATRSHLGLIVVYAFVHFGVPWYFMSSAEQHLSSSVTGMLVATTPMLAAVVAKFSRRGEEIGPTRVVGLGLGAAGVALLVGIDFAGSNLVWLAAMGLVVVGYTFGPVILSRRLSDVPGLGVVTLAVTAVALAYTPYGATHLPSHVSWSVLGALAVLAFVCTAAAFLVMFELVREVGPSRMVVVTFANTAIAVLLGVAVLSEPLTSGILLGFPLIIVGSFLATSRRRAVSEASPTGSSSLRRSWRRESRPTQPR